MSFTINGRTFDARLADTVVKLNSVGDWQFRNPTDMDHPMHIHTNPFQDRFHGLADPGMEGCGSRSRTLPNRVPRLHWPHYVPLSHPGSRSFGNDGRVGNRKHREATATLPAHALWSHESPRSCRVRLDSDGGFRTLH